VQRTGYGRRAWKGRGRFPGGRYSRKDERVLDYLSKITIKYRMEPSELFRCIAEASKTGDSRCGRIKIECRAKMEGSAVFLFTTNGKVLAQFPIPNELTREDSVYEDYVRAVSIEAMKAERLKAKNPEIKDLRAGMKRINLRARVMEISKPRMVYTRFGTEAFISNALIADKTGTIRVSLWNRQISMISKGDIIIIRNGKVARFKGERQLRIGRNGTINVVKKALNNG